MPTNQHGFPFNGNIKLKEAALIYVEAGFSIIPLHWIAKNKCSCGRDDCASPAKHPVTQHGLKDASNDPDQVKAWWKQYPKANIGVCTGHASNGLTVIDFDLQKGAVSQDKGLPVTLEVTTGNGFHLWFRSDQEIRNSAGKLGQGIDIRGWGGYVVAPPSVHHSGRVYSFANQSSILDFPPEILAKLQPEPDNPDLILSYAPDMADFAPEGSRNDFLTKIGGKLRRQGFSPPEIESTLLATNLQRCSPPLADKEVRQIARSVSRYIPAQQIETQIEDGPDLILPDLDSAPDPDEQPDQDQTIPNPFPPKSGKEPLMGAMCADDFDLMVFGQPEMILQGLYKGEWGLVVGIGSVGKTTLLLDICVSLAAGRGFASIVPTGNPPRRILFVDFEGPEFKLQKHVRIIRQSLTPAENALAGQNLYLVVEPEIGGRPWRLTDKDSLLNLAAFVKKYNIDLVIIDTLSQASNLRDENSNAEVQQKVVLPIRRLVKHCDISMLLVHHEGRGKQQDGASDMQYRGRGATALMDASRYQIAAVPLDKNVRETIKVVNSKNKGEGFEPVTLTLDKITRWFSEYQPGISPAPPPLEESIIQVLEGSSDPDGMELKDICTLLPGAGRSTIKRMLTQLVKDDLVVKTGYGRYKSAWADFSDQDAEDGEDAPENDAQNTRTSPP
jgi:hypothetical protein